MAFGDVLVHVAVPLSRVEGGEWVEGERVAEVVEGSPFACCLFLPQGSESGEGRGRRVREPTLLYGPVDSVGGAVALSAEDEVLVTAAELNVAEGRDSGAAVRWMVVGQPQPFGRPGSPVVGFQAALRRVEDG